MGRTSLPVIGGTRTHLGRCASQDPISTESAAPREGFLRVTTTSAAGARNFSQQKTDFDRHTTVTFEKDEYEPGFRPWRLICGLGEVPRPLGFQNSEIKKINYFTTLGLHVQARSATRVHPRGTKSERHILAGALALEPSRAVGASNARMCTANPLDGPHIL